MAGIEPQWVQEFTASPGHSHIQKWTHYKDTRKGSYEFRCATRYKDVADRLLAMGLNDTHTVMDVGAGSCQFGRYLRERGWRGLYIPVDAVIDGVDLETWAPPKRVSFVVCIETLEHVRASLSLASRLQRAALSGVVLTTPNPEAVDVLGCDPTHVSTVWPQELAMEGYSVEPRSWFGIPNDSLLAWRQHIA